MEYFFSHIIYFVIAAFVLAGIIMATSIMAEKNAQTRSEEENQAREEACKSCALASMCTSMGHEKKCTDKPSSAE